MPAPPPRMTPPTATRNSPAAAHERTSIPPVATLQRFTDRRVLITGGGSGIGQATVLRILDEGGIVVAADVSEAGLADTEAKAGEAAAGLTTVVMDVGSEESVIAGVSHAVATMGGLDALVNAAGILRSAHFTDTTLADFEQVLRVNLVGTFLVTREAVPALRDGTAPAVVNFSSTSANFAHPYCRPTRRPRAASRP